MSLEYIKDEKIIAVLRNIKKDEIDNIIFSLKKGGVNLLEITLENPEAIEIIKYVRDKYDETLMVGAGTVLDAESARSAIMAGAQFIFSPSVDIDTIKMTKRYGVISIPGALTPTEILTAYENGADAVKVFPIGAMNTSYLKDIAGPFPYIPIVPTGGVNLGNVKDYLSHNNVVAVGVGSSLVDTKKLNSEESFKQLTETSKKYRELASEI